MGDLERLAGRAGACRERRSGGHRRWHRLERLAGRAAHRSAGRWPAPQLTARLDWRSGRAGWLQQLLSPDPALAELAQTIRHKLVEAPPLSLSEGDLIHDGVDPLLDGLRNQLDDQDAWLSHQEQQERQRSGISTLKLQHHRTFGRCLAVAVLQHHRQPRPDAAVPDHCQPRLSHQEQQASANAVASRAP